MSASEVNEKMSFNQTDKVQNQTILSYKLTPHQNAYLNYLIPSIVSFTLYCLLFAAEIAVIVRHYRDENHIWASITILFMFLPALGSYIFTISSWELWPDLEGWTWNNFSWFFVKTYQHAAFPVWTTWRYAERIFWSIEAVRSTDLKSIRDAIGVVAAPRNVELYLFLQAFLHSLPQLLFQLAILMRFATEDSHRETNYAQMMSFVLNLTKLSATVAYFQRFKSQKLTGRRYPWHKPYKKIGQKQKKAEALATLPTVEETIKELVVHSRRSSGSFMEPNDLPPAAQVGSVDEPDFSIKRLLKVMGLPEDDVAGKAVAFCWWFAFLLARVFAISAFAYFYLVGAFAVIGVHFVLMTAFLLYDVKTDDLRHSRMVFFLFIGFVYIFCVVEFKIRFKKATVVYYVFFILVYAENFLMCIIWMVRNRDELENDFWFRYMFYTVIMCFVFGVSCMIFYNVINKPKKVVVQEYVIE